MFQAKKRQLNLKPTALQIQRQGDPDPACFPHNWSPRKLLSIQNVAYHVIVIFYDTLLPTT